MGRVEWFTAEVTLPSAAVAPIKQALTAATNRLHDQAKAAAHDFWENYAKRTRSPRLYEQRLEDYRRAEKRTGGYFATTQHVSGLDYPLVEELFWMLEAHTQRPHKLTAAEVAAFFPKATNRNTTWNPGIGLKGRTLSFGAGENKNVRDEFASHPVGNALYIALDKVTWTRGTGGRSWGSDEYSEDAAREHGYNPVSTLESWGPLGDQHRQQEADALFAASGYRPRSRRR